MQKDDVIYRQAAIDVLEKSRFPGAPYIDTGIQIAMREIKKLPSAQSEQLWIPCSERLPKHGTPVLWSNKHGSVFISAITFMTDHSWAIGNRHRQSEVIAWMPLPEPYMEGRTK